MKYIEWGLFFLGAVLLVFLIYNTGIDTLYADITLIGWGFALVIAQDLIAHLANTLGWRFAISPEKRTVSFTRLFICRLAGDGINHLTPTATIGGEFVKVRLLQPHIGGKESTASVTLAKFAETAGQTVFIALGFILILPFLGDLGVYRWVMFAVVMGFTVSIVILLILFKKGFFRITANTFSSVGIAKKWFSRYSEHIEQIDATIRRCTGERRKDLCLSIICFTVAFATSIIEVWIILHFLGLPTDWYLVVGIEVLSVLIDAAAFMIPFKIGAQEGGKMLIFRIFALDPARGLALGVIKRGREMFWSFTGLILYVAVRSAKNEATEVSA